ncbi:MAG: hypothetical protein ABEJ86_06440 [Halococcoides sp.]
MSEDRGTDRLVTAGFVVLAVIAAGAAAILPGSRSVLIALAGTAAFGALLTRVVAQTPGHPDLVAAGLHDAHASTVERLAVELGLSGQPVYVPVRTGVRLYLPVVDGPIPSGAACADALVTDETRGMTVEPTGSALLARIRPAQSPETTDERIRRLTEAVVDRFELAAAIEVTREDDRVEFDIEDPTIEDLDRLDHPIASTLAVGLAEHRDTPVRVRVDDRTVICSFEE